MSNIVDYLLWRGDIPINDEYPFNEIDSMIMARFSYLIFQKINLNQGETIGSISDKMKEFSNEEFNYNGDKALITNLGKSRRFRKMKVTDYVANSDLETEKQFSAITIHISEDEMYISYEGTDKTINGWKEDFNLGFLENVPAQTEGVKYASKIAEKYSNKKIRIGGHSKGGNIAVYTAIFLSNEIANRVIEVNNFDGPGFSKNIIQKYKSQKMWDKVVTYIPQDSVVGRLLEHEEKCIVVLSLEKGIYQHDIYSWQVIKDRAVTLDEVTDSSELINSAITEWLENTSPEKRKIFVDQIFEILYSVDVTSTIDIKSTLIKKVPDLIKAYRNVDEEERKTISEMVKVFIKSYFSKIKENESKKFSHLKENIELKRLPN